MDVETAFLNGDLEEEIYMEMPEGFEDNPGKVCKLNKTLYGLKQSAREWNMKFVNEMKAKGFLQSTTDPCVFFKKSREKLIIISIFVDDNIIIGTKEDVVETKEMLSKMFKMKDLGDLKYIVGIKVEQTTTTTNLSQSHYINDMLHRFNMQNCKPSTTPLPTNINKDEQDALVKFKDETLYKQAIGSLIYLANATRPDISFAVSQLARKMQDPSNQDWHNTKRIFRYLQGTKNMKLVYQRKKSELCGFSDASYAEDRQDRKSTSGHIFMMNGGAVSWKSNKQPIVSLSSMEAEYIALASAVKEGLWLKKFEKELLMPEKTLTIFQDNQSTIKTASHRIHNDRSKHIDVRYHFIRECVEKKVVRVEYCPTNEMTADALTKSLGRILHERHVRSMGLVQEKLSLREDVGISGNNNFV
jgi:hypothetical protein